MMMMMIDYVAFSTGVHLYWASGRLHNQIFFGGAQYLWVLSVELTPFRPPGTRGVGVASRSLGSSCTNVLYHSVLEYQEVGVRFGSDTCPVIFA